MPRLLALLLVFSQPVWAVDVLISQLTDAPDPAPRGGNITYTITTGNQGTGTATNVVTTFPLPDTTTFVSVDDAACSHDANTPGTVTCNFGDLQGADTMPPTGESRTVNVVVATTASTGVAPNPNPIVVQASVTNDAGDTNAANDTLGQQTTITAGADLNVAIVGAPNPVNASDLVTYSVDVNNLGPNDAQTLTLSIDLNVNLTYVSASGSGWSCSNSGQTVTCTRASLTNGSAAPTVSVVARVTGAQLGTITTTANISADTTDPDPNNNVATADVDINAGTDVSVTIGASSTNVIQGDLVSLTLRPRNNGPHDADNVEVQYTLPTGWSINTSASGTGWTCGFAAPVVSCTRPVYTVGATDDIGLVVQAPSPVAAPTNFTHPVVITTTTPDGIASNNNDSVNILVNPDGADLELTKSKGPNPVAMGSQITNTITVVNNGPRDAASGTVTVQDVINTAVETYVSFSGTNWSCVDNSPNIDCTYNAALNNGASTTLTIITQAVATANATETVSNTATAGYSGSPGDYDTSNNSDTATVTSTQAIADLQLNKAASAENSDGDITRLDADPLTPNLENTITYTLTLFNHGPDAAGGITLTDPIPGFVSGAGGTTVTVASIVDGASADVSTNWSCTTGSTVTCSQTGGATLSLGAMAIFTITVTRPIYAGSRTNNASAYSSLVGDDNRSNNTDSATVYVEPVADVMVQSKTVTPNPVRAGVEATYTITVRNNGPSTAQNVQMVDSFNLPAGDTGFTFISYNNPAGTCSGLTAGTSYTSVDAPALTCNLGALSNGQAQSVTVKIRPNFMTGSPARTFQNSVNVSTTTYDDNAANDNLGPISLNIVADEVDLLINNSDTPDPVAWDPASGGDNANNDVVYDVAFTNNGPSYATGVQYVYYMQPKINKTVRFDCDEANPSDACGTSADTCSITSGINPVTGPDTLELTCTATTVTGVADEMTANSTGHRYLHFRIISKPDAGGDTHATNAVISANEIESLAGNNAEAETTSVLGRVDLQVGKTASPNSVQLHQPFDWVITVTNNGPVESTTTTLTDTLPANMALHGSITVVNPDDAGASCNLAGQDLTCDLGLLNNGSTATITIPMQVISFTAASQDNCASATTNGLDLVTGNNTNVCGTVTVDNSYFPADYGDAPDGSAGTGTGDYTTTFDNGGARHLQPGLTTWLGACVDADGAGTQQNTAADADDVGAGSVQAGTCAANDDEDGVVLPPAFIDGQTADLDITISGAACTLDGWIDYNRDGDFDDANEQIFTSLNLAVGTSTQTITVPAGITVGNSYARFRCSPGGGLGPEGEVTDGEVEDYLVSLQPDAGSSPTPTDYGDAPDTGIGTGTGNYQTSGADDGASHVLGVAGAGWMGQCVDSDVDGQQDITATADDTTAAGGVASPVTSGSCATAGDDEDGVTFNNLLRENNGYDITVSNGSPNNCLLNAWIDFNGDGDFNDANEQIASDGALNAGNTLNLTGTVPAGFTGYTYARFRCSSDAGLNPFGAASDGEVEDYRVIIAPDPAVTATDFGDAPDATASEAAEDYSTTLGNNGPEHRIQAAGPWLGQCVDSDAGTAQSLDALADDGAAAAGPAVTEGSCAPAGDDEDGVAFNALPRENQALDIEVSNGSATSCLLNAWIDYNRNGDFTDAGEQIATDVNLANGGTVTLNSMVPVGSAGMTWARFRCASSSTTPTGLALDGEVEDYRIQIQPDPAVTATDFGDNPDSSNMQAYADLQTLLDNNGPAHVLVAGGPYLGTCVDSDLGTAQDLYAQADDSNAAAGPATVMGICATAGDDEDGVSFNALLREGQAMDVTVTASPAAACLLNAWIDYNRDGDFEDAGEQLVTDANLAAGASMNLTNAIPSGSAGNTWARFRCSTQTGLGPEGPAADGEVEDYRVEIQPDPASTAADFGDAPDTSNAEGTGDYSTILDNNGPSHLLNPGGPYLGACVDSDDGNAQAMDALADDGAVATGPTVTLGTCAVANEDEDGLEFMSPLNRGSSVRARITTGPDAACLLNLWIDFDQDGVFNNMDEHVIADVSQAAGLTVDHRIQVPYGATEGDSYVRLRCSSDPGLGPTGPASDGEVEDYLATISAVLIIPTLSPAGTGLLLLMLLWMVWRRRELLQK